MNTEFLDGCPIQAPDGLSLYMATNRPGGLGGIGIWVTHRSSTDVGFGTPVNLGAPVNSAADDFCPSQFAAIADELRQIVESLEIEPAGS